jgi:molybdopterin converting factor small subunit
MHAKRDDEGTIDVRVRLFADLRRFLPRGYDGPLSYTLHSGATVDELLAAVGIAKDAEVTAGLNGDLAQRQTVLSNGDELVLFSPMEGGAALPWKQSWTRNGYAAWPWENGTPKDESI